MKHNYYIESQKGDSKIILYIPRTYVKLIQNRENNRLNDKQHFNCEIKT